jgi:hypothetical protein
MAGGEMPPKLFVNENGQFHHQITFLRQLLAHHKNILNCFVCLFCAPSLLANFMHARLILQQFIVADCIFNAAKFAIFALSTASFASHHQ